jgi:uncharacterized protein YciI
MFHVLLSRSGPAWRRDRSLEEQSGWEEHAARLDPIVDAGLVLLRGPPGDGHRVVHAVEAESEEDVRATLARDPWSGTHLRVEAVEPWTIRLDGRRVS